MGAVLESPFWFGLELELFFSDKLFLRSGSGSGCNANNESDSGDSDDSDDSDDSGDSGDSGDSQLTLGCINVKGSSAASSPARGPRYSFTWRQENKHLCDEVKSVP